MGDDKRHKMKKRGLIILVVLFATSLANAQSAEAKRKRHYNIGKQKIAIQRYDPVSYFVNDTPMLGKKKITYTYNGIQYLFANEKNKKTFMETPAKYEPEYGGWCAALWPASSSSSLFAPFLLWALWPPSLAA